MKVTKSCWPSVAGFLSSVAIGLIWQGHCYAEASVADTKTLRLAGKLTEACAVAEAALGDDGISASTEVALRLELARIHDRVGLHTNTRPVAAALEEIEKAENVSASPDPGMRGAIEAAKAYYFYRAGMRERDFSKARAHVTLAIDLLGEAERIHDKSDAVHLLGLINLFERKLARARELFDVSLALDQQAGSRKWMLGEYHRHVALVYVFEGDWQRALPHYAQSLQFRKEAGAVDASLFAAISLGEALMKTDQSAKAEAHLLFAVRTAEDLASPVGKARAYFMLGSAYDSLSATDKAESAFRKALTAAQAVDDTVMIDRIESALGRSSR